MSKKNFELYIRQQCKALDISLTEAAKKSDMSRHNLYKLMSGSAENARVSTVVKLANTLQTHPQILLRHMFESINLPVNPTPLSFYSNDGSAFVRDVTIPDNTKVKPGQSFIKTWKIQNAGSVEWLSRFMVCMDDQITFTSQTSSFAPPIGKRGLIPSEYKIAIAPLLPGETTEISVEFSAPEVLGSCISYWKMCDSEGNLCFPELEGLSCQVQVLYL